MSKNYPSNYPHNTECEWLITLPVNHPVIFSFMDFDIEGGSCAYDYVDVSLWRWMGDCVHIIIMYVCKVLKINANVNLHHMCSLYSWYYLHVLVKRSEGGVGDQEEVSSNREVQSQKKSNAMHLYWILNLWESEEDQSVWDAMVIWLCWWEYFDIEMASCVERPFWLGCAINCVVSRTVSRLFICNLVTAWCRITVNVWFIL